MLPDLASKRFEMIRCLGEGGMGVVYEALDRDAGARVALKTLRHASPDALARLKHEFRAMQDVQHPHLVALRELVFEGGQWFIVMDLVEGVDFISYVRGSTEPLRVSEPAFKVAGSAPTLPIVRVASPHTPLFDEARLRSALRQVAEGLHACHSAGFVHRDVKPSNLLVTRDGHVVILDFGLVAEGHGDSTMRAMAGTPAYMAPEQAASGDVGPEADWYSVGVLLYEALTGRVPIEGAPLQVMLRKQNERPIPPSAVGVGVPEDLDALCISLLRFHARERPPGAAVLRELGAARSQAADDQRRSRTLSPPFVGREDELAALAGAFAESRKQAVSACVEGESGVGKSRLVRRLTERITLDEPRAVVFFGRCYERESVPYKAFDGIVDAIARFLARLPDAEARALLPTRPLPLVQVFPILGRVSAIASLARDPQVGLDPHELRSRAFAALREMFVRIAEQRPLVVVIDDAQWADEDSHTLLAEVLREPDAPRMLLVATVRSTTDPLEASASMSSADRGTSRLVRVLGPDIRIIGLKPLSPEASRELAALLLQGSGDGATADAITIAAEAGGHPLFIDILARQNARPGGAVIERSSLEGSLRGQLSELDAEARAIVQSLSLADRPLRQRDLIAAAAEAGDDAGERCTRALQRLRVARLIVSSGSRGDDLVEPYHDRVRQAVLAGMPDDLRAQRHRRIALALETAGDAKPQALALHWGGAGDPVRSAHYSALAGARAAEALAFDRAASFYEQALPAAAVLPAEECRAIRAKLGDALANGGRGKRAADALHAAAEGAPAAEALDLRRRAAEQLAAQRSLRRGTARPRQRAPQRGGSPALDSVRGARLPAPAAMLALRARPRVPAARHDPGLGRGPRARRYVLVCGLRPGGERHRARHRTAGEQPHRRAAPR